MAELVIFGLLGIAAGFAYINYLLKKRESRSFHTPLEVTIEEQEVPPNYEEAQTPPPPY